MNYPPNCPNCGNNRQVWVNQITGKLTCHRLWCNNRVVEEEIPEPLATQENVNTLQGEEPKQ